MKRIISAIIVIVMLAGIVPLSALNVSATVSGSAGENAIWTCASGTKLVFSVVDDSDAQVTKLEGLTSSFCNDITEIEIGVGITAVGDGVFYDKFPNLEKLYLTSVRSVGNNAFGKCGKLETVSLSPELEKIGVGAFALDSGLKLVQWCGTLAKLYAVEVEENNDALTDAAIEIIGGGIKKNAWNKDEGGWYFVDSDGCLVKNEWKKDSTGWCHLGADGYMETNAWVQDSKGWCYCGESGYIVYNKWVQDTKGWYYLGKDGYIVKNQWMKDSKGWCFLSDSGLMYTNAVIKDSKGYCYVDKSGYWVTSAGWRQVGSDWVYVQKGGYLKTNGWMQDSKGWCYLNAKGIMLKNTVLKDSKGYCYVDASGYWKTTAGWCNWNGDWVYVQKGGYLVTNGWAQDSKGWCYLDASGRMLTDMAIRDKTGWCYVDASGYWKNKAGSCTVTKSLNNGLPAGTYTIGSNGYLEVGVEYEILSLVNAERAKEGLSPLKLSGDLNYVADIKAKDMRDKNYVEHESPTYGLPNVMLDYFNVPWERCAENIAAGQRSCEEVMTGWMNSLGHRANILDPDLKEIGIGHCTGGYYGNYWVQLFR